MSMTLSIANSRIVAGSTASISYQGYDQDGEPADPGVVTVAVTNAAGTTVVTAGTATTGSGSNPRSVTLPATATASVDVLTATWSVSGSQIGVTTHDVVGGVYLTVAEIRALEPALSSATEYPAARIIEVRRLVEQMFESATGRAFVPRFRTDLVSGDRTTSLIVRRPDVRSVRFAEAVNRDGDFEALDITDARVSPLGVIERPDGWPLGIDNIRVGYEFGLARPPDDLRQAAVQAIRAQLNVFRSGIPDRATSFQPIDGGNVVLATPGLGPWVTGIPAVDECIKRYKWRDAAVA